MTFDKKLNTGMAVTIIAVLSFFVFIIFVTKTDEDKRRAACEAAGGYWFAPRNAEVCLRKEYVVPLK